jgi:DASS family divalent anion:Na+ symporter
MSPSSFLPTPPAAEMVARLRAQALFAGLPGRTLARLLGAVQWRCVPAGQAVTQAGSPAAELLLVWQGCVQQDMPHGRGRLAVDLLGEEILAGQSDYVLGAQAIETSYLLVLPRRAVQEMLAEVPGLGPAARNTLLARVSGATIPQPAARPVEPAPQSPRRDVWGWGCTLFLPLLLLAWGLCRGWALPNTLFLSILTATVCMWMFSLVDEFVPPLFAMAAMLLVGLAPSQVVLSGFASSGLILFVGVYVLGGVLVASGLSYRLILWMRLLLPDTPFWHGFALVASGYVLSPIMPSGNARMALVLPLYRDFCSAGAVQPGSVAHTRLAAATYAGSMNMSPMFLTSKSSNLIVFAMLPAQLQDEFQGLFWFVAALVCAAVITLGHFVLDRLFFGAGTAVPASKDQVRQQMALLGPMGAEERFTLMALALLLLGAVGVSWHHIPLPWVGGFILVALLLYGLVSKKNFQNYVDWPMVFFLLSLQGLTGVMDYLHLVDQVKPWVEGLASLLQQDVSRLIFLELLVVLVIRLALPITAGMVVSAILLMPLAAATGINPWLIGFLAALFSDLWFFPYQSSSYSQLRTADGKGRMFNEPLFLRFNLASCALRVLAVAASIPYWDALDLV